MSVLGAGEAFMLASGEDAGYTIQRSLRFSEGDQAYLNRTPSSAGNRKTYTLSFWVKKGKISDEMFIFAAKHGGSRDGFRFESDNTFRVFFDSANDGDLVTSQVFRDPSAWHHFVIAVDTTQGTAKNRVKIYVNGTQIEDFSTETYPDQNYTGEVNNTNVHRIGADTTNLSNTLEGYLADVHFIDGQALAPTDFGKFDADTGAWNPIEYTGDYNDAGTPGTQYSTTSTISNASGMFDGDTNNYVSQAMNSSYQTVTTEPITFTLNNGSFTYNTNNCGSTGGSSDRYLRLTRQSDGVTTELTSNNCNGWTIPNAWTNITISKIEWKRWSSSENVSAVYVDGTMLVDSGTPAGTNGFHLDFSDNSSNAALGTDSSGNTNTWTVYNLIGTGGTFQTGHTTQSYGGNGTSQSRTGVGFSPDLVWIKSRTLTRSHFWFDTKRGATKFLQCDGAAAQVTDATSLTSFDTDGFSLGARTGLNDNNHTFAAWMWDAGSGSYASNTSGTITTSTKQNGKFAITHWDTNAAQGTIGTGLSSVDFCILKAVDGNSDWNVWHKNFANTNNTSTRLRLNAANTAEQNSDYFAGGGAAGNGKIALGSLGNPNNEMIAYSWKEVVGESKFGYYQGNGTWSGAPQTITCGFKPALVLIKATSVGERWVVFDSVSTGKYLYTSEGISEISTSKLEILDNGFKVKGSDAEWNDPNHYYVYAAWSAAQVKQTDSLLDSPTNGTQSDTGVGGEISGNYATFNPLMATTEFTYADGNLETSFDAGDNNITVSTIAPKSGKWYAEIVFTASGVANNFFGEVAVADASKIGQGFNSSTSTRYREGSADIYGAGTATGTKSDFAVGDVIGVAVDADNDTVYFYKNNTLEGTVTGLNFDGYAIGVAGNSGTGRTFTAVANYGQRSWVYSAPSGYKALCTTNLDDPLIADPSTAFDAVTYTGNGSSKTISGVGFSSDLIWTKCRNQARSHYLMDTVRGISKYLVAEQNSAEGTNTTNRILSVTSDGWTLGANNAFNGNNDTYVAWAWDAGDLVTNSAYNQSQTWSSGMKTTTTATTTYSTTGRTTTFPAGTNKTPFNGDLTDFLFSKDGVQGTWWFLEFANALTNVTSIEFNTEYSCPGGVIKLNGTDVAVNQSNIGGGYVTVSVTGAIPSSLTEIAVQGYQGSARLKWVKINGKYLLDPGVIPAGSLNSSVYDQSQTWSNQVTGTAYSAAYAKTNAFDMQQAVGALPADNNELVFTPSPAFSNASTVKIWYYYPTTHANAFKINGTAVGNDLTQTSVVSTHTFNVSGFTSLSWSRNKYGSEDTGIVRIDVDGVRLVDAINDSVTWSDSLTALSGSSLTNPANGFDTNESSYADSTAGFTLDLSGHTFGTGTHTIEVKSGGASSFTVNGTTSLSGSGSGAIVWSGTHTGELNSLTSSATGASVYYIKIDGKYLANPGQNYVTNVPSIASTVRANQTAGFSIVKVDNPTSTESRAHGLNKKPDFIIGKALIGSQQWHIYHSALGKDYYGTFQTNAFSSSDQWGSKEPDSNLFYVKSNTGSGANFAGGMIYYIWHAVENYSAFGSYEGTGNTSNSPFVFLGFKPAVIIFKNADSSSTQWDIYDTTRDPDNLTTARLFPSANSAESNDYDFFDVLSNGFKIRNSNAGNNGSGNTILYAAWASNPFKTSRAH
tara:strand:+ start:568 stop:5553 length:4986 start_codon:yes stop_codon:yes gene_type:complete